MGSKSYKNASVAFNDTGYNMRSQPFFYFFFFSFFLASISDESFVVVVVVVVAVD